MRRDGIAEKGKGRVTDGEEAQHTERERGCLHLLRHRQALQETDLLERLEIKVDITGSAMEGRDAKVWK